jgi:hypothetical protein
VFNVLVCASLKPGLALLATSQYLSLYHPPSFHALLLVVSAARCVSCTCFYQPQRPMWAASVAVISHQGVRVLSLVLKR